MIADWIQKYLPPQQAVSVLDVGPGYSDFSRVVARVTGAREITFFDYAEPILSWQAERAAESGLNVHLVQSVLSSNAIAALPGGYDVILCQEVLEHLLNAGDILKSLVDHLSVGGCMVITVPTRLSERLIKCINPAYMRNVPHGHVNEFSRRSLLRLLTEAGLSPAVFFPTQPHYFLAHLWLFGTRVPIEGSSGRIVGGRFRARVFSLLVRGLRIIFRSTCPRFWGYCFPRNYFVIARHAKAPFL